MRTLRRFLVGMTTLALLAGSTSVVVAQDTAEETLGVQVTVTQECVSYTPCRWTADDPRLPDTLAHEWVGGVGVEGDDDIGLAAGFTWMDVSAEDPEGGWTGHVYALWGLPVQNFLVLSGTGANEGWHYIASGTDPLPDGDFDWIGTLYEGELPPFPIG